MMTIDTKVGSLSYKIGNEDCGTAVTDKRFCSEDWYPGVSGTKLGSVKLISFEVKD